VAETASTSAVSRDGHEVEDEPLPECWRVVIKSSSPINYGDIPIWGYGDSGKSASMVGGRLWLHLLLLAQKPNTAGTAGELFSGLSQGFAAAHATIRPPAPPAALWAAPPSTPPPTIHQRIESEASYRCRAMGVVDRAGCCETEGIERFCCQPCRLVWLNITSSGLTERGHHYRVQQCLPVEAAVVRATRITPSPLPPPLICPLPKLPLYARRIGTCLLRFPPCLSLPLSVCASALCVLGVL
jgi:hypothetical protein